MNRMFSCVLACMIAGHVAAEETVYFTLEYDRYNVDASFDDWNVGMLTAGVGKQVNKNLAVEGFAGFGVTDDEWGNGCDSQKASANYVIGTQLKAFTQLNHSVQVFGTLGFSVFEGEMETSGAFSCYFQSWTEKETYDDSSLNYGFGMSFDVSEIDVFAAYRHLYDDGDVTVAGLNIGFRKNF